MPYGSKLHIPPTNYHLLAAQQEPYKKAESLTKYIGVFWKTGEWTIRDSREEGDRGLGRKQQQKTKQKVI